MKRSSLKRVIDLFVEHKDGKRVTKMLLLRRTQHMKEMEMEHKRSTIRSDHRREAGISQCLDGSLVTSEFL